MNKSDKDYKKYIDELRYKLHQWEYEYYVLNKPTVDDYTYDKTLEELKQLEQKFPEYYDPNSPTSRVGGEVSEKFIKRKHNESMLSLNNSYNVEDIRAFYDNIVKQTKQTDLEFICEPKIDGLSISCIYDEGNLQYGVTRGDGEYGEDVTANIKTIANIPLKIDYKGFFEARGEVYLPKHTLLEINKNKENAFMNTRNTASGALRNLDPKVTKSRKLSSWFYFIPLYINLDFKFQYDVLEFLKNQHFPVALDIIKKVKGIQGILDYINFFDQKRNTLDYDVDGVVIKLNNRELYPLLGTTSKFPKYAIAYKYPPTIAQTKLIGIILTVGRTGKINFTAQLEPIKINGSIVKYATLHNADYINERDIRINDYVNIYKAAEIIPKISNPILELRQSDVYKFNIPKNCPVCGKLLFKNPGEVDLYCVNDNCPAIILQKLIYFCSKDALDIEGLSEATIKKFNDMGILNDFTDFYKLKDHYEQIISLDLHIKQKMLNKILNNIEKSKEMSLERILTAIGIKFVGQTTSKSLAMHFKDIDNLMNSSIENLLSVQDIGEKVASSIYEFFHDEKNLTLIKNLKDFGINFKYKESTSYQLANVSSPYFHKNFAVTGKFSISREEIIKLIEEKYLGKVSSNITKKTDYLVVGEKPSSKLAKANELNIKKITEEELKND